MAAERVEAWWERNPTQRADSVRERLNSTPDKALLRLWCRMWNTGTPPKTWKAAS